MPSRSTAAANDVAGSSADGGERPQTPNSSLPRLRSRERSRAKPCGSERSHRCTRPRHDEQSIVARGSRQASHQSLTLAGILTYSGAPLAAPNPPQRFESRERSRAKPCGSERSRGSRPQGDGAPVIGRFWWRDLCPGQVRKNSPCGAALREVRCILISRGDAAGAGGGLDGPRRSFPDAALDRCGGPPGRASAAPAWFPAVVPGRL